MCTVNIFEMPLVLSVIEKAEKEIFTITGKEIKLQGIDLNEKKISPEKLLLRKLLTKHTGLTWNVIISKSREPEKVLARCFYSWVCVKELDQSVSLTARELNKDHATVLNCLKICQKMIDKKQWDDLKGLLSEFTSKRKLKN